MYKIWPPIGGAPEITHGLPRCPDSAKTQEERNKTGPEAACKLRFDSVKQHLKMYHLSQDDYITAPYFG